MNFDVYPCRIHLDAPIQERCRRYREMLLDNVLPFWMQYGVDREYGGYHFGLGRYGELVDPDKSVWAHGRFIWLLATLYNTVEARPEWLETARHGVDFLLNHCVAPNGKLYFLVAREGTPLRMRRYYFSESFAAMGLAAFAKAAQNEDCAKKAVRLFEDLAAYVQGRIPMEPKWINRPAKGLADRMVLLSTGQCLRDTLGYQAAQSQIDWAVDEILRDFYKPDHEVILETVAPNGEIIDTFDGRLLNPGHAIEAAWFLLDESVRNKRPEVGTAALNIIRWMWQRGWDREYGGLFYFRDLHDRPIQEYWHDMKFWWPQNEAEIALLMAWRISGESFFRRGYEQIHDYAFHLMPDPDGGEWFGYYHRDGSRSSDLKGNHWKGPFHIPRMLLCGWKLLSPPSDG